MAKFTYRGIPGVDSRGNDYVQPVRGIVADDGKTYRGVKDVDSRGEDFVWNQVPDDGIFGRLKAFLDSDGFVFMTSDEKIFAVR